MRQDSGGELLRRMSARRRRDNLIVGVIAVMAVIGGGSTLLGWVIPDRAAKAPDSVPAIVGRAQLAGAFAEEFVVTYLSATDSRRDAIGKFIGNAGTVTLPKTRRQVSEPSITHVFRAVATESVDVWSVTVSVLVGEGVGADVGTRQYYRVAVSVARGALRALALPALVDGPSTGSDLALVYSTPCAAESPLGAAVSGFLTAYLTGSGDLTRYSTVNSGIRAPSPPPFAALDSVTVSADHSRCGSGATTVRLLATVTPRNRDATAAPLAYPLTTVLVEGQWLVRSLDPIPGLSEPLTVVSGGPPEAPPAATPGPSTSAAPVPSATHN